MQTLEVFKNTGDNFTFRFKGFSENVKYNERVIVLNYSELCELTGKLNELVEFHKPKDNPVVSINVGYH